MPADKRQLETVVDIDEQGERHLLGEGFTVMVNLTDGDMENGEEKAWSWAKRRLVLFSPVYD